MTGSIPLTGNWLWLSVGTHIAYLYMLISVVISMVGELGRGEESAVECETYLALEGEWERSERCNHSSRLGNNVFCSLETCF